MLAICFLEIKMQVDLKESHVNHLLTLLRDAAIDGAYYGSKRQYWSRHAAIEKLLTDALLPQKSGVPE